MAGRVDPQQSHAGRRGALDDITPSGVVAYRRDAGLVVAQADPHGTVLIMERTPGVGLAVVSFLSSLADLTEGGGAAVVDHLLVGPGRPAGLWAVMAGS